MRSEKMVKRYYHDDEKNKEYVPVYYLMHNIPELWDDESLKESYSIIARYADGDIRQWFYGADDLESAFRVFRIMSIGRRM